MLKQSVIYPPRGGFPFHITAKRYYWDELPGFDPNDPDAITLVLLHATGFHKETWEPSLERVFHLASRSKIGDVKIREAWAIECPNHGASAQLNDSTLQQPAFRHNCAASCLILSLTSAPITIAWQSPAKNLPPLYIISFPRDRTRVQE
jgi:hypothetical protein